MLVGSPCFLAKLKCRAQTLWVKRVVESPHPRNVTFFSLPAHARLSVHLSPNCLLRLMSQMASGCPANTLPSSASATLEFSRSYRPKKGSKTYLDPVEEESRAPRRLEPVLRR